MTKNKGIFPSLGCDADQWQYWKLIGVAHECIRLSFHYSWTHSFFMLLRTPRLLQVGWVDCCSKHNRIIKLWLIICNSDARILTHPAHKPGTAHPLQIGQSEEHINPTLTTASSINPNGDCVIHRDLSHIITTYLRSSAKQVSAKATDHRDTQQLPTQVVSQVGTLLDLNFPHVLKLLQGAKGRWQSLTAQIPNFL